MELSNRNELLSKYHDQIDNLRQDMRLRSKKYQEILSRLKDAAVQRLKKLPCDDLNIEADGSFNEGVSYYITVSTFVILP